ncbi:hypothetical protein [Rathayibacter sp. Leaf296]|uniref:hypothetical protein n=1 Tax=Rathayibacter sp. Leaf296 TaxID=1736327 RepID=UPI0007036E65|nr:hypothetical protein [Rathayibacter sp. Leaf296]KQQ07573.1 hypothetical protein ASF46_18210 [Rathayibacter sp. Leaf296]
MTNKDDGVTTRSWRSLRGSGKTSKERIDATRRAEPSFAHDIERTAAPTTGPDTTASQGGLAIRTLATARSRTKRRADRASRRAHRAARARQKQANGVEDTTRVLEHPRESARLVEALDHDVRGASIAYLVSSVPGMVVAGLAGAMILNDPPFVMSTVRTALDLPTSVPLWHIGNPDVLVSLASAVSITLVLLGAARLIGASVASAVFLGPLLGDETSFPEARRSRAVLPRGRTLLMAAIGTVVLAGAVLLLHILAEQRFAGGVAAVFSGSDATTTALASYVTWLPVVVVLLEIVAHHPVFVHTRRAARWSVGFRMREARDVRRDRRRASRAASALRSARLSMAVLGDMLGDVGLRSQSEYLDASIGTGRVSAHSVARLLGVTTATAENADSTEGAQAEGAEAEDTVVRESLPPLDLSGRIHAGWITTSPVSNRVLEAIHAYRVVAEAESLPSAAELWKKARASARTAADRSRLDAPASDDIHLVDPPAVGALRNPTRADHGRPPATQPVVPAATAPDSADEAA